MIHSGSYKAVNSKLPFFQLNEEYINSYDVIGYLYFYDIKKSSLSKTYFKANFNEKNNDQKEVSSFDYIGPKRLAIISSNDTWFDNAK